MSEEDGNFKGKLVLVTGGGSGIGRATCQILASLGARVAIGDINLDSARQTRSVLKNADTHLALYMDVSKSESVRDAASKIEFHFHTVPFGVVHCAAIVIVNEQRLSSLQCAESDWDRIIDVNLKGTFLINTIFAQLMRDHELEHGSIVNVTSLARDGYPPFIDYSASKAGVVGITKTLASELGQYNIRVNAVAPAMVQTPMLSTAPEIVLRKSADSNPMRRLAQPNEIAQSCVFLLRNSASGYINGQVIGVDGGETKLVCRYD